MSIGSYLPRDGNIILLPCLSRPENAQPDRLRELGLARVVGHQAATSQGLCAGNVKNIEGPGSQLRRLETTQLHASVQRLSPEEIRQIESALLDVFLEILEGRIPKSPGDVAAKHGQGDAVHQLGSTKERQGQSTANS